MGPNDITWGCGVESPEETYTKHQTSSDLYLIGFHWDLGTNPF